MGKAKLNIPMFAALILLLLTMVTTHMTSGLYARYTTSASGSDSARVAKFRVTGALEEADDGKYSLTVTNSSEVAVEYSINVEMHPNLSVAIDEDVKTFEDGEPLDDGKTSVTFENKDWTLAPGGVSEPLILEFEVANWRGLTNSGNTPVEEEQVILNFTVNVIAEQID